MVFFRQRAAFIRDFVCLCVCGQPIFVQRFELVKAMFLAVVLAYRSFRTPAMQNLS